MNLTLFVRKLALKCFWVVFEARQLFVSRRELISESGNRTAILSVSSGGRSCRDVEVVGSRSVKY